MIRIGTRRTRILQITRIFLNLC
ncbi:MAG: hypothetical protein RLZZ628_2705, partial [Bacteroidota bacterium]